MPVLVLVPIVGYIHCGQIRPVSNPHLRIVHNFLGSSNNVNYMDSEFLQHCAPCLDSICVFLVVTDLFHTFISR